MPSDHMDIPPPPQIGSFGTELPSFSGPAMGDKGLEIPSFDASPAIEELPEIKPFSYEEYEKRLNEAMPETMPMPAPIMPVPALQPVIAPLLLQQPEIEYEPSEKLQPMHEKAAFEAESFVEASVYREIIEGIDATLSHKIEEKAKDAKENEYSKMADCIEDIQRKLMEIDSKLFEV